MNDEKRFGTKKPRRNKNYGKEFSIDFTKLNNSYRIQFPLNNIPQYRMKSVRGYITRQLMIYWGRIYFIKNFPELYKTCSLDEIWTLSVSRWTKIVNAVYLKHIANLRDEDKKYKITTEINACMPFGYYNKNYFVRKNQCSLPMCLHCYSRRVRDHYAAFLRGYLTCPVEKKCYVTTFTKRTNEESINNELKKMRPAGGVVTRLPYNREGFKYYYRCMLLLSEPQWLVGKGCRSTKLIKNRKDLVKSYISTFKYPSWMLNYKNPVESLFKTYKMFNESFVKNFKQWSTVGCCLDTGWYPKKSWYDWY